MMRSMLKVCILLLLCSQSVCAQEGKDKWVERRTTADGDKIYVRRSKENNLYDVRIEADLPGTIGTLYSVLKEVDKFPQWAYGVKTARIVTWKGSNGLVYYAEYSVPWPLSNRDEYAEVKFTIDTTVKHTATVITTTQKDYAPEKKGLVRLTRSKSVWEIATIAPNKIHLSYILEIDPGGSIPSWIINLFITKAPADTFKQLRKRMIEKSK